jgi:thiol-disulfide isomerase/thioredoxin
LASKNYFLIAGLLILSLSQVRAQEIVHWGEIEKLRSQKNDTTYVLNFWATWCIPCVEELPEFQAIQKEFENQKVKIILISLDSKKRIESQLKPFLEKRKMTATVLLLDEPDYNQWIDKIDQSWEGNIPATWIWNNKSKFSIFIPESTTFETLKAQINKSLK